MRTVLSALSAFLTDVSSRLKSHYPPSTVTHSSKNHRNHWKFGVLLYSTMYSTWAPAEFFQGCANKGSGGESPPAASTDEAPVGSGALTLEAETGCENNA